MKVMSRKTMQNVAAQYAIDHYQEICFNAVEESTPYIVRQTVAAVLWALKLHGYGEKRLNDVFKWTCEVMSMPKVMGSSASVMMPSNTWRSVTTSISASCTSSSRGTRIMSANIKAKPEPPCGKVCDERAAGCQAYCKRWKAYEVERAAWYDENQKRQAIIAIDAEMKIRQHEKLMRKKRDRKRRGN